jgi:DnaK suppressor protein
MKWPRSVRASLAALLCPKSFPFEAIKNHDPEHGHKQKELPEKTGEETEMTKSELNKYRNVLQAKQAELAQLVRNRDGIAIEKSPDAFDEVQHATERELAIRNLDRESNLLRNVRASLRRIEDGSFGVCLHCEEDISPKRLAAVPWTAFCIQCQEIADRSQADSANHLDEWLVNAA